MQWWERHAPFYSGDVRLTQTARQEPKHLAHPTLPQQLAAEMADAGFIDIQTDEHVFLNTNAGPDAYSGSLIPLITDFVTEHGVAAHAAATWTKDLHNLDAAGRHFFAITKFSFTAARPQ